MSESMEYKPQPIDLNQVPKPLPSMGAVSWIAWFSLREMSRRRRLLSLGAINLLPVLVVLAIRIWFADQGINAQLQLSSLTQQIIIPFLIPIVAMAVGVSAIGEQVEEGTIVYLWTRPVKRRAIHIAIGRPKSPCLATICSHGCPLTRATAAKTSSIVTLARHARFDPASLGTPA